MTSPNFAVSTPVVGAATDTTGRGILCMALAVSLFAIQNALVKWLAADYSAAQIMFFRHAFAILPIGYFVWRAGGWALFRTNRPQDHLIRGLLGSAATMAIFYAFGQMPLANATAIAFTTPMFITALSVPMLGEQVGWRRWSAVAVGFAGVLIVLRPGPDMFDPSAMLLIGACFITAATMIMSRKMSRTEHTATISIYYTVFGIVTAGIMLLWQWQAPDLEGWLLFAGVGLLGGGAFVLLTQAYQWTAAAVVAPFEYIHILWAIALGFVFWQDLPDAHMATGAAVVIGSGLYILHRETVRGGPALARRKVHPRT